jgi:hypothetical protein
MAVVFIFIVFLWASVFGIVPGKYTLRVIDRWWDETLFAPSVAPSPANLARAPLENCNYKSSDPGCKRQPKEYSPGFFSATPAPELLFERVA